MHEPFGYGYATRERVRPDETDADDDAGHLRLGGRWITALAVLATRALVAFSAKERPCLRG